ncbi:MAG: hypothetical protein QOD60_460 [Solirubrobacterales bacterium]|jgi:hypothetical protein|nr:hypothetical protein [Solirubrobacterales bacterium]
MKSNVKRPSPAMVIAIIALILAVAGTATAALNSKDKKKVKKIADQEITAKAPGLSVASAGSATSATNATNAANATNATTAAGANAVNGFSVTSFNHRNIAPNYDSGFVDLLGASGFHGVRVQASCTDNGGVVNDNANMRIVGTAATNGGFAVVGSTSASNNANQDEDQNFNTGDTLALKPATQNTQGTATIQSADGSKTATITYYGVSIILGLGCEVGGTVTSNG